MRVRVLDRATGQAHSFLIQGSWDAGITVGSGPECDLVLTDPSVASRHVATTAANARRGLKALAPGVRVRGQPALAEGATTQATEVDVADFALSFVDDDPLTHLAGAPPPPEGARFRLGISASMNATARTAPEDTPAQRATDEAYEEVLTGRWLAPDASLSALESEAQQWVRDRIEEHFALLSPFLASHMAIRRDRVIFSRSLPEACALWRAAWCGHRHGTGHLGALEAAERALPATAREATQTSRDLNERVELAWWVFREHNPAWRVSVTKNQAEETVRCGEELARQHLAHRRATGLWSPLHAIWQRGAWPMALPEGAFLVLVPVITPTGEMATDVPSPPSDYAESLTQGVDLGEAMDAMREFGASLALRPYFAWRALRA